MKRPLESPPPRIRRRPPSHTPTGWRARRGPLGPCLGVLGLLACGSEDPKEKLGAEGDACDPASEEARCEASLHCDPLASGGGFVCGQPVTLAGEVFDALGRAPLSEARVVALSAEGTVVGSVAHSTEAGRYSLEVAAPRNEDGTVDPSATWTLNVAAQGYEIFPAGPRPAIPIGISQAGSAGEGGGSRIEAENTSVGLLPLPDAEDRPRQIHGRIEAQDPGGTLVVAEGAQRPAPYGIADAEGNFSLFNVPPGEFEVAGYRQGQQLEAEPVDTRSESAEGVVLSSLEGALSEVSGSVNIVNAPGEAKTSVVLVPESVFDAAQERGPVPMGLRAPGPPLAPSVSSAFELTGVPRGEYMVLAAFENDRLVRDPDEGIGGTALQRVSTLEGGSVSMSESFKVTEHLAIVGPGATEVERVEGEVLFEWEDDSSEDYYSVALYTALGDLIWQDEAVPSVSGEPTVRVAYPGPALTAGMVYQFRVTSYRDRQRGPTAISRSEDLRGAFQYVGP